MSNFNINDRVLIVDESCMRYGKTGEITNMMSGPNGLLCAVSIDDSMVAMWYTEDQLKHFDMPKPIEESIGDKNET